jgi:hypothetical protein
MKQLLLSTALFAGIASAGTANAETHDEMFRTEADAMEVLASDFIGMRVYASESGATADEYAGVQDDWNDVGEINDVILGRDGEIDAVLVDIGGFLGIGERQIAVSMSSISFVSDAETEDAHDFFLVIPASRAILEDAPEFSIPWMNADLGTDIEQNATPSGEVDTTMRTPIERDGYMTADVQALTSEMLTGAPVFDPADKRIGEVSELTLTDAGEIESVIIDVGGFLGLGEKPVALTLDQIDILRQDNGDDLRVFVSKTEAELEAMPTYEK